MTNDGNLNKCSRNSGSLMNLSVGAGSHKWRSLMAFDIVSGDLENHSMSREHRSALCTGYWPTSESNGPLPVMISMAWADAWINLGLRAG